MPKNEFRIFFENIINLRHLLKEGVGGAPIIDAINDRKYVYIYYAGDKTILKGYRTILPMVLGENSNTGNRLLRAWQVNGNSDSKDKYLNKNAQPEYGWRLFNVDKITSFLPTGKSVSENKLPPSLRASDYNPNDSQMTSISAAMKIGNADIAYDASTDITKIKVSGSTFDQQAPKFRQFFKAAEKTREASAEEIKHLYDLNKQIRKKAPSKLLVIQNEKGDMVLRDITEKDKLPPESIVGILADLYNEFVSTPVQPDNSFIDQERNTIKK